MAKQLVTGKQVFVMPWKDAQVNVQVGVGTQDLNADQCREFSRGLEKAADELEQREKEERSGKRS